MPEFELDLTNVESEVVDGVTVIKSAEVTAVSIVGLSAEEAAANLHANARRIREGHTAEEWRQVGDGVRAMADSVAALGIGSFVKAAAEAERVRLSQEEGDRG